MRCLSLTPYERGGVVLRDVRNSAAVEVGGGPGTVARCRGSGPGEKETFTSDRTIRQGYGHSSRRSLRTLSCSVRQWPSVSISPKRTCSDQQFRFSNKRSLNPTLFFAIVACHPPGRHGANSTIRVSFVNRRLLSGVLLHRGHLERYSAMLTDDFSLQGSV